MEALLLNPALRRAKRETLRAIEHASTLKVIPRGGHVVRFGAPQTHVLLLASGRLELFRRNREARTQMLVGTLEPPAIFGDAELYAGTGQWMVSARAVEKTQVLWIPTAVFTQAVDNDGTLAALLYRDACARHMLVVLIMQIYGLHKTQHKLLGLLWNSGTSLPESGHRVVTVSQARLTRALGVERKTVARHLVELEQQGFIERSGDSLVVRLAENVARSVGLETFGFGAAWRLGGARSAPVSVPRRTC